MNSITNPWIAGIAAGIVSGILVAWISQLFLSRRDGRGALEKTAAANREILQAVRLSLAEGSLPRRDAIAALTRATARRQGLSPSDLFQTPEIAEELMKDVMESPLLSATKKSDLCAQLSYLLLTLPPPANAQGKPETAEPRQRAAAHYGQAATHTVSTLTGILAGVLSGVFAGRELLGKYLGGIPRGLRIGLETLAGIAAALAALLIVALIFRDAGRQEERPAEEKIMFGGEP